MKTKSSVWWLSTVLVAASSTIAPAMADDWNKETRLQVNEPVKIPGRVLMPGKYVFKLADSQSNRNIVEVFSEDEAGRQQFVKFILAIPAYKMDTPDKAMIGLEERPAGSPQAIHNWFYPGNNYGWEFVYPKSERLEVSANQTPAEQPQGVAAVEPPLPGPPAESLAPETPVEPELLEAAVIEGQETLILIPLDNEEPEESSDPVLPETAGHSAAQLAAGAATLGLGLLTVFAGRRRAEA